jgi:VanZ family protein
VLGFSRADAYLAAMLQRTLAIAGSIRTFRAAFWSAAILAVVMAVLPKPPHLPIDRFGDKFEHMLAFSVLALLGALGWPAFSRWRVAWRLSLLGALIEMAQAIPVLHRDSDIRDWIADTLALGAVLLLVTIYERLRGSPGVER